MFEDLDDPQAPAPSHQLRDTVVRIAAHRRMRRRLVAAAVAALAAAVPVALVATRSTPERHFSVSSASDNRSTSTTSAPRLGSAKRAAPAGRSAPPTTWNGVLHCDARPLATRQLTDKTLVSAQRFGRWIVTTHSAGDHQTLNVQDCSTNKSRGVPAPPPGRLCSEYGSLDMGADVLLYRCSYADGTHQVIANDLTKNTVTPVTEAPDRPWRSGSMAPGGAFVAFTGAGAVGAPSAPAPTDVFVFDLGAKTLDRLPRDIGGVADRSSTSAGISVDGRTVLVSTPPPPSRPDATEELYLFDRTTRQYTVVPTPGRVTGAVALSGDGRHVGFQAVPPTAGQGAAAYAFDFGGNASAFVSMCAGPGSDADCAVHISEDGGAVTFTAQPCVSVTGTSDRTGGTYTFDRAKGTIHKDADATDTRDCTPPAG
jgi:hypothetical protein